MNTLEADVVLVNVFADRFFQDWIPQSSSNAELNIKLIRCPPSFIRSGGNPHYLIEYHRRVKGIKFRHFFCPSHNVAIQIGKDAHWGLVRSPDSNTENHFFSVLTLCRQLPLVMNANVWFAICISFQIYCKINICLQKTSPFANPKKVRWQ